MIPLRASAAIATKLSCREGDAFGRRLDLDPAAVAGHDEIGVGLGRRVLGVVEIEQGLAAHQADRNGGDRQQRRQRRQPAVVNQPAEGRPDRQRRPGDRGGAGAAVGIEHIAVDAQGPLAERLQIDHHPQAAADQALDLEAAAGLARGLAAMAGRGGAGQHAVLGGNPALSPVLEKRRHALLDGDGAEDMGAAHPDQHRGIGLGLEILLDGQRPQAVGGPVQVTHDD